MAEHALSESNRSVPLGTVLTSLLISINGIKGPFLLARAYLRQLKAPSAAPANLDKASIVLIGSTAGKFGEAGHIGKFLTRVYSKQADRICGLDYASTKSALQIGFCLSLKNEIVKIAPKGRVNAVAPGWVSTPMAEGALQDPDIKYQALAT